MDLAKRSEESLALVGVIGLGYAGLPLTLAFARAGFSVLGFDTNPAKVKKLMAGTTYLASAETRDLPALLQSRRFAATDDFSRLGEPDAILICVPTPLTESKEPDLSYVTRTAEAVAARLRRGQLVVLESTTYPGTTEEVVLPILERSGLRCPAAPSSAEPSQPDFYLAFSSERIDPGNTRYRLEDIPKIVGGVNPASTERARALYAQVVKQVVTVSSTRTAEMVKLLENIYRAVNIALVNELKLLCQRMKLDVWEVIEAAATKPFGFTPFQPGPGLGGHCIPIDPFYLSWKAQQYGLATRFIELAGEINTAMPAHVVATISETLQTRKKDLRGARILLLGVAYKKDVDDLRESPALKIIELLRGEGAQVAYNDPHVPALPRTRRYNFSDLRSVPLESKRLAEFDCVVIVTDHSTYDWQEIVAHARVVIDTRNATRGITRGREKTIRC
ncbi:MAG: nucleotide sugar dehydrogenase [Terriglobia bacterium]